MMSGDSSTNGLVTQLQREVANSRIPLADILRKAQILASRLRIREFKRWVDAELKGYGDDDDLPVYRKLHCDCVGTYSAPFGMVRNNIPIPVTVLPDNLRELATSIKMLHGVKEIEMLADTPEVDSLQSTWPPEYVAIARKHVRTEPPWRLALVYRCIPAYRMAGIVDQVRNRLLDFLLKLEQLDTEMLNMDSLTQNLPSERIRNIFNTTVIHGGGNIVATGTDVSQTATQNVITGDTGSLVNHLRHIGIDGDSIKDLETAIEQDGERAPKQLGENVKAWVGRMTVEAMEGIWKVALRTAPRLLQEALFRYYGWN